MDDNKIVELYWQRNEHAIAETAEKYGAYCMKISYNILADKFDSEENVNDTYMQAWNSMPPHRPDRLLAYLSKLTRNLALNRYKAKHTKKRMHDTLAVSLDELSFCTPSKLTVEDEAGIAALGESISDFLRKQDESARKIFVSRYFFCESTDSIANRFGYSKSKVKTTLMRTRNRLKNYLETEGYYYE